MTYVAIALGIYLAMSIVTFAAFALDKRKAKKDLWRTPEKTLLLLSLAFGWPGGMLAMKLVRHKTRTKKFTIGMPLIAGLHLVVWAALGWMIYQG
jgi:uncharacterized membrane protein YsdA (DUF1294 family)